MNLILFPAGSVIPIFQKTLVLVSVGLCASRFQLKFDLALGTREAMKPVETFAPERPQILLLPQGVAWQRGEGGTEDVLCPPPDAAAWELRMQCSFRSCFLQSFEEPGAEGPSNFCTHPTPLAPAAAGWLPAALGPVGSCCLLVVNSEGGEGGRARMGRSSQPGVQCGGGSYRYAGFARTGVPHPVTATAASSPEVLSKVLPLYLASSSAPAGSRPHMRP